MEIRNEVDYSKSTRHSDVSFECATEYVLPDYNGDVRRILYTSATVRPSGCFVGDGSAEHSGITVFDMVYLDGEGELGAVSFTSDYDFSVKCPVGEICGSHSDVRVSNFIMRLLGPRKISAKATLVATPHVTTSVVHEIGGNVTTEKRDAEALLNNANVRKTTVADTVEREYAEPVAQLDGAIADEVSVIHSSAYAVIESTSPIGDELGLDGYFEVDLLIKNAGESAYREQKRIPFNLTLTVPDGYDPELMSPTVAVPSLRTTVNPTEGGSEIVVNLIAEASAVCDGNTPVSFAADAYLTDADAENEYTDVSYTELLMRTRALDALSFDFPRDSEEVAAIRELVLVDAQPKVQEIKREDGHIAISGDMRINGVVSTAGEEGITYAPIRLDSPFTFTVVTDVPQEANERYELSLTVAAPRVTLSPDRLSVSVPLTAGLAVTADRTVRALSSCNAVEGSEVVRDGSTVTVYYPTDTDTLFDVAKRYRTTPERIALTNALASAVGGVNPAARIDARKLVIY